MRGFARLRRMGKPGGEMYEKHFGLTRRPFASTAEPPACYPATAQEQAFRRLVEAIQQQEGFAVLTGDPGTGKTLLAQRILDKFSATMVTVWVANTHLETAAALYQALLYDLNQPFAGKSEQELRLAVMDHILAAYKDGRTTLLVIDEAHHLPPELLEETRLLGNLESRQGKAVQTLLIGQPALRETLDLPELAGLRQRIATRVELAGLEVHESVDYLIYLLRAAGGRPERIVTAEAFECLAEGTRGVPRLLNQATHRAFQLAQAAESPTLDAEAAVEALHEMGLAETEEPATDHEPTKAA